MELFATAAKSLLQKRSQLSFTVCGIAIGVFSVLMISIIGGAGERVINGELEKLGFDCVTVFAAQEEMNTLSGVDLPAVNALEEVAIAAPLSTAIGRAVMRDYAGEVLVCGVDQNAGRIIHLELKNGRLLQEGDVAAGSNVCVIDDKLAYAFYHRANIVGKELTVTVDGAAETFTVVGVVDGESSALKNLAGDYIPSFLYIPYTTHQALTGETAIHRLFVKAAGKTTPEAAGERVASFLNRSAGYRNLYRYEDLAIQKDRLRSILRGPHSFGVHDRSRFAGPFGEPFGHPCQRRAGGGGRGSHRPAPETRGKYGGGCPLVFGGPWWYIWNVPGQARRRTEPGGGAAV